MNLNDLRDVLTGVSQVNRPIRLRLSHERGVADEALLVKQVSGIDTLCGGFEYRLLCVSSRAGLPIKQFIALPVELQLVTDSGDLHCLCGIVAHAIEGQSDGGLATYQLIVRDALSIMDKRSNTRVFRNASEIDITETILRQWRQTNSVLARAFNYDLARLLKPCPKREFTLQSNESDAAFLRRLWKRRGIAWFFEHGHATEFGSNDTPVHTLVLFDNNAVLKQNVAGTVRYHRDDGTEQRDSITAWHAVRTLSTGSVTRQSWDYLHGKVLTGEETSRNDQGSLGNRFAAAIDEHWIDVPHAGDSNGDYADMVTKRMQHHEYTAKSFQAESGVRTLYPGQWIGLTGHAEIDTHAATEREFIVTEVRFDAENNLPKALNDKISRLFALNRWHIGSMSPGNTTSGSVTSNSMRSNSTSSNSTSPDAGLAQASAERGARYNNQFTCVRRAIPIVPSYDPRIDLPRMAAQSVVVVGPPGEEVYCDYLGRVRVRFPGCRPADHAHAHGAGSSNSDRDSAWVRVASSWASAHYGANSLPRPGDECIVEFMQGDPDKPVIIGRVHGGTTPPPSFSHIGSLPGNRYLSGIKSKEIKGQRYNQLRMDDSPGQISAQLASEHGHSELNLGYLTHPRSDGHGTARGEGAELRSDKAIAIRGGQGVYISADARLRAVGRQLERDGLTGLAEVMHTIQQQLADLAQTHHAGDTDGKPLGQLTQHIQYWEQGSNTAPDAAVTDGGKPVVAIDGPAGVLVGSGENIALAAQSNVDIVSVGNTQLSSGRNLLVRAANSISLFAHKLGMKLIAASGKIEMQAHQGDINLTASGTITLTSAVKVVIQAPELQLISQGAQTTYCGGAIVEEASSGFVVKAPSFSQTSGGAGMPAGVNLPSSVLKTDEKLVLYQAQTGLPVVGRRYTATLDDGQTITGTTDSQGHTSILKSTQMGNVNIVIHPDDASPK